MSDYAEWAREHNIDEEPDEADLQNLSDDLLGLNFQ
jgi:hypothetical protein